jgi:hypothetical protein
LLIRSCRLAHAAKNGKSNACPGYFRRLLRELFVLVNNSSINFCEQALYAELPSPGEKIRETLHMANAINIMIAIVITLRERIT